MRRCSPADARIGMNMMGGRAQAAAAEAAGAGTASRLQSFEEAQTAALVRHCRCPASPPPSVAETLPLDLCFHCLLRLQEAAFAVCFRCVRGLSQGPFAAALRRPPPRPSPRRAQVSYGLQQTLWIIPTAAVSQHVCRSRCRGRRGGGGGEPAC